MLGTALAQLRVAASVAFGLPFSPWALNRLVAAALATQRELGSISAEASDVVDGPTLEEAACREVHQRRFRTLAQPAARQTTYFRELFTKLGVDPARLSDADIANVPPTTRTVLQNDLDADTAGCLLFFPHPPSFLGASIAGPITPRHRPTSGQFPARRDEKQIPNTRSLCRS